MSSLEHFGQKSSKLSMRSSVLEIFQGHYLNLGGSPIPNATYPFSRQSIRLFGRRKIVKVSTMYRHGCHVGLFEQTFLPLAQGGSK